MKYDFDKIIDRRGSGCLKYDFAKERGKAQDLLPLWVADMDFEVAIPIKESLQKSVEHGIFGYDETKEDYFEILKSWYRRYFDWEVKKSWLIKTPGIVFALAMAVRAYTKPGDSIIIQEPVYYPFSEVIRDNDRTLVSSPLILKDGKYEMDFDDFEKKIIEKQVKLFILCSPHNPVGRVWTREELERIGNICVKHNVIVISDEIHSDFVYDGYTHTVFANIKEEFEKISITCTAPSKTFNIAGLQISNIFIPDITLRKRFIHEKNASGYSQLNSLGLVAAKAAYKDGREWLEQVKAYIRGNLDFVRAYLQENLPDISLIEPQGTYLIWLDFRKYHLSEKERVEKIENEAKLWLDTGTMFGESGAGFERINLACPRSVLERAMENLKKVF